MPTNSLYKNGTQTLVENVIYATPPTQCLLYAVDETLTYEFSATVGFSSPTTLTLDSNNQCYITPGFIRCTDGDAVISLSSPITL
jgi:hypothetical protein